MKQTFAALSLACAVLLLSSCGNQSSRSNRGVGGIRGASIQGGVGGSDNNFLLGSGDMGSPNGATSGSAGTPAPQTATTPQLNSNPFARNYITTATDPQQCANVYNSYQRFEGNFERALYDLTTCLNQVMIRQNPTLFQQYQNLYQQQQYPQYGYGYINR